jgi:hypothetical protein
LYWIRFRIVSTVTTLPVFVFYRALTNRVRFSEKGYITYSGKARPVRSLPYSVVNFTSSYDLPADTGMFYGNIGVGIRQNTYVKGDMCKVGILSTIPQDFDSCCPIVIKLFFTVSSDATGIVEFNIRWDSSSTLAQVSDSANAPTTTVQTSQILVTVPPNFSDKQLYYSTSIYVPQDISYTGDNLSLFWAEFYRDARITNVNDTYLGDVRVLHVSLDYCAWSNGGSV